MAINQTTSHASSSMNIALERARREREEIEARRNQLAPLRTVGQLASAAAPMVGTAAGAGLGLAAGGPAGALTGAGIGLGVGQASSGMIDLLGKLIEQQDNETLNRQVGQEDARLRYISALA